MPAQWRALGQKTWDGQIIGPGGSPNELVMMGRISDSFAGAFKKALSANPAINTLIIDSQGGDMSAALDMAAILRERRMRLVVDGRCLSACAHFLFPAAVRKTVLPGSLVGIHGKTYYDQQGNVIKAIPEAEAELRLRQSGRRAEYEKLQGMQAREAGFFREMRLDTGNYQVFRDYLQHRQQTQGDSLSNTASCPLVQMWVLNREQLEAMGVQGIDKFWFPANAETQQQALRDLGISKQFFYFGSAAGLEALCRQPPSLRERWARWLASLKSAFAQ